MGGRAARRQGASPTTHEGQAPKMGNATALRKDANVTRANTEIEEETLFSGDDGDGGSFLMDLAEDGYAELIQELTDASARKGAYAMREAISNAIDAVRAAGRRGAPDGIVVEFVTRFCVSSDRAIPAVNEARAALRIKGDTHFSYVVVTDRGIGMSGDELRRTFSQYGSSDKRGKGAIGSKGLGAKAPLAVSDRFFVASVKHGIRTTMTLWHRDSGNYASIDSMERVEAEHGTTVVIPVADDALFKEMQAQARQMAHRSLDDHIVVHLGAGFAVEETGDARSLGRSLGKTYRYEDGRPQRRRYYYLQPDEPVREFVYMGSMPLGEGHADLWRAEGDVACCVCPRNVIDEQAKIDVVIAGASYPLLRDGSVGSSSGDGGSAEWVVACDPGYLNFTISRDDIKEDDAWRRFVLAVGDAIASLDMWPATMAWLFRQATGAKAIFALMRDKSLHFVANDDGTISVSDGLTAHVLTDEERRRMLTAKDEDGRRVDLAPVIAPHDDDPGDGEGCRSVIISGREAYAAVNDGTAWLAEGESGLSAASVRKASAKATRSSTCAPLLAATRIFRYRYSRHAYNEMDSLHVVVLTEMGGDAASFGTADLPIRKMLAGGGTPADAEIAYLLCEGAWAPTPAEKVILGWFGDGWESHRYGEFARKSRAAARKQADENRKEKLRLAEESARLRPVTVVRTPDERNPISPYALAMDGIHAASWPGNIDIATLSDGDLLAVAPPRRQALRAIGNLYAALVRNGVLKGYSRLVIVDNPDTARMWGLYGAERPGCDVLYDDGGVLPQVMPAGIRLVGDMFVADAEALGYGRWTTDLVAACLASDEGLPMTGVRSLGVAMGSTGDRSLDAAIASRSFSRYGDDPWRRPSDDDTFVRIVPSARQAKRYGATHAAAERLGNIWRAGVNRLFNAIPRDSSIRGIDRKTLGAAVSAAIGAGRAA